MMKKLSVFLIIPVFMLIIASPSYAKNTYVNAGQADAFDDAALTDPGKDAIFGVALEDEYDESLDEDVLVEDGMAIYLIKTNKIKKLYVYGDNKNGTVVALLLKVNDNTGAYEWMNFDPTSGYPDGLSFSSGKATVIDSTIKKSKKETWVLVVELTKSETEGDESPIIYGIKYKS